MSRSRTLLLLLLGAVAVLLIWGFSRRSSPPEIPFTRAARSTVVSALSTNGKVEPIEWASARAERQGVVAAVYVQKGQAVSQGDRLIELDSSAAAAELAKAEAEISAAQAQQQLLRQGGPSLERTQIESDLISAKASLAVAQRDHESLERLAAKQAATRVELEAAGQRVEQAQLKIDALEKRRAALVVPGDLQVARARLEEARAAADLARRNLSLSEVRAPIGGTVYQFDPRIGSYVNPGDLIANIGRLEKVRVIVYVDEPDLGRVEKGMPVTITWAAMPGRQWKGVVDKLPTQVVPLGSRQVGEVQCVIDNPDRDLLPGTNIDAEIQSHVVVNALAIPREALRRENGASGVYLLSDGRLVWTPVKAGVSSYTRVQVLDGLKEGNAVALPSDKPMKDGMRVAAVYP